MTSFLEWCEGTSLASTLHASLWLLPAISAVHVLALVWVIGGILVISLRLLGLTMTDRSVSEVAAQIGAWRRFAIAVSIFSGLLLFIPDATKCAKSALFVSKMVFLALALLFHFTLYRYAIHNPHATRREHSTAGAVAMTLWFGVALLGSLFTFIEG
jgi:hypothetical protein